jgi:hypothetical protein
MAWSSPRESDTTEYFKPFTFAYLPSYCKFVPSEVLSTVIETEHDSSDCTLIQSTDVVIVIVIVIVNILNVAYLLRLSVLEYHSKSFSCCRGSGGKVKTAVIKYIRLRVSKYAAACIFFGFPFM